MKTLFLFISLFIFSIAAQSQESTYRNPVIPGDFPDPSVIRVGDTYYAAASSSEWGAPYQFLQSKDLVNWEDMGPLFKEMPPWTMGSYWAPELFYRDGTFFVYYTARRKSDRKSYIGVATTNDIKQGFTDHGLIIEWTNEAIDAYVIELEGKLYITWKAYGLDKGKNIEILGSELSADGLKLKGDVFTLLKTNTNDWEAGGMEGQCIVKHGDYLYMFYAGNNCCGLDCNYQTGVARAKSIRGPWEKYAKNPILIGDDYWRCTGHGTLVETPEHRYFYLYHAYNALTNVYTGRESMLDEIIWDAASGWPAFRYGRTPSLQAATPYQGTVQKPVTHNTVSNIRWIWNVAEEKPITEINGESITIQGKDTPVGTFLGFRIQKGNYTFQTNVESGNTSTGICLYGSADYAVGLSLSGKDIELWQVKQGVRTVLKTNPVSSGSNVKLSVVTRFGQYCQFGYDAGDGNYKTMGESLHIKELLNWDRPPMLGIQSRGSGKGIFKSVNIQYSGQ